MNVVTLRSFAARFGAALIGLRKHPWRLVLLVVLLGGGAYGAVQGYAWYELRAADAAVARYQNDAARGHLQACLRIWPESVPAHFLAARVERRAGNLAGASQHLDECRRLAGSDWDDPIAFEWALLQACAGDLAAVEETLQARLLRRPAEAPLVWEALSAGYRRSYRLPDALVCLNTWLHFDPENAYAYFLRGEVHRQVGAVNRARDEYRRAVELDPTNDQARRLLARCQVNLGRFEEADEHLQLLERKLPDDPEVATLRARCEHGLGRSDEGIRRLDEVVRRHPRYTIALRERGRLALAAGDFPRAAEMLERALELWPHDYDTQFALQQALQNLGRKEDAQARLAQAQQLKDRLERINEIRMRAMAEKPNDAALDCELGQLLLAVGQRAEGERWLQSALRLDPALPAAHAALAEYYEQAGDTERAQSHRQGRYGSSSFSASSTSPPRATSTRP